jgi:MFS family permease
VGGRLPLVVGSLLAAVGFALFARGGAGPIDYWTDVFPAVFVMGLGFAILIAPLSTIVMNSVDARHAGVASGINNFVSRVAGLLAVALVGLVVARAFDRGLDRRLDALDLSPDVRARVEEQRDRMAGMDVPEEARTAVNEAFLDGYRAQAWASALAGVLGALCAAVLVRESRRRSRKPVSWESSLSSTPATSPRASRRPAAAPSPTARRPRRTRPPA